MKREGFSFSCILWDLKGLHPFLWVLKDLFSFLITSLFPLCYELNIFCLALVFLNKGCYALIERKRGHNG
jgi:hypothetical protein